MLKQDFEIQIETFKPIHLRAFVELNRQWIETYFRIEAMDIRQFKNPRETILDNGGEILVATMNGEVLGVCALIPHGPGVFELAKMAVYQNSRGRGIGDRLLKAAIDWVQNQRAEKITLLSNTVLEPAIQLYRKYGFQVVRLGQHPDYERADIEMELELSSPS